MQKRFNLLMTTAVLLILAIPVGIANIYLGYVVGESPCTLCWFERIGMILIGVLGIFILRYGAKIKYVSAVFICAAYGLFMSIRHTSLDGFAWDVGMGFGDAIFGAHTYTWGAFVYWAVVLVMPVMLLFAPKVQNLDEQSESFNPFSAYTTAIVAISFAVIVSNAFQAFFSTGVPPFSGKGEPERISLNLAQASDKWTAQIWTRLQRPFSLTGKNKVQMPHIAGALEEGAFKFNENPNDGAVKNLKPALKIKSKKPLAFKATGIFGQGNAGGLAYDAASDEFAVVSTAAGVYFLDGSLENITHRAILDKPNGYDIRYSVDSTFADGKLITTAFNKTLWAVEKAPQGEIDKFKEWNTFRESSGGLKTSWYRDRPVVLTVRAKKAYVLSIASDPASEFMYMFSVPNEVSKKVVVIKVDKNDQTLSAESVLKAGAGLELKDGRDLNDYYITGADVKNGKILALSKNYNTLLVVDAETMRAVDAYELPAIGDMHAIAIKGESLFILSVEGGQDVVYELESPNL